MVQATAAKKLRSVYYDIVVSEKPKSSARRSYPCTAVSVRDGTEDANVVSCGDRDRSGCDSRALVCTCTCYMYMYMCADLASPARARSISGSAHIACDYVDLRARRRPVQMSLPPTLWCEHRLVDGGTRGGSRVHSSRHAAGDVERLRERCGRLRRTLRAQRCHRHS